jgi:hypothetical protein
MAKAFSSVLQLFTGQLSSLLTRGSDLGAAGAHLTDDCSGYEKEKSRKGRNHSDDVKRCPAVTKLLPVAR